MPIKLFGLTDLNSKNFEYVKRITKHFIMRRTKNKLYKELGFPSKKVITIRAYFSHEEKKIYESIYKETKHIFNVFNSECDTSYVNIFLLIQKLRMAANHPFLLARKENLICSLCLEDVFEPVRSQCGNLFCRKEAEEYFFKK